MKILKFSDFILLENIEIDDFQSYINYLAGATSGKQKEFYEWEKKVSKEIKIEPVESVFPKCTKEWIRKNAKIKNCFQNSAQVLNLDPEIKYVEGICMVMGNKIPIEHAWNSYKGRYFDITKSFWEDRNDSYHKIIELDYKNLWTVLEKIGAYDAVIPYMFRNNLLISTD